VAGQPAPSITPDGLRYSERALWAAETPSPGDVRKVLERLARIRTARDEAEAKLDALRTMLTSDEAVEAGAKASALAAGFTEAAMVGMPEATKPAWHYHRNLARAALAAAVDAVLSLPAPGDPGPTQEKP
jgi:hypothetical protein